MANDIELYRAQVLTPDREQSVYASLPRWVRPEVFDRNFLNALMTNPDLMQFPPHLVFREVSKAAALGLYLDPLLGEAYLVTAYNYKSRNTEPQLRVGYKGTCKLARQTGNVANIYAHEVYSLDHVEAVLGHPKMFHHKPKLFGERGAIVGYVAVIAFKDGTFDFEPMSRDDCLKIRDRSDAWKAFSDGKIKSTPWATDEVEMCKKTVLRRLLKRQDQSPEMIGAQQIEDEAEHPTMGVVEALPPVRRPPPAPAIEHQPEAQTVAPTAGAKEQPATAEAAAQTDAEAVMTAKQAAPYIEAINAKTTTAVLKSWHDAHKAEFDKSRMPDAVYELIASAYKARKRVLTKQEKDAISSNQGGNFGANAADQAAAEAKEIRANAKPVTPKAGKVPDVQDPAEYEKFVSWCNAQMDGAADLDVLESFFNSMVEDNRKHLMPPDYDGLMEIYQRNEKRLHD